MPAWPRSWKSIEDDVTNPKAKRSSFLVFGSPAVGEEEINAGRDVMLSGWMGTGPKPKQFEEEFRAYVGREHAVAVNSCTAALFLSLHALSRLEASVRSLNGRVRAYARIEADTQKLMAERAKFASDLDKASARAKRLDDTAAEVSRRLVVARETVNEVLRDA